MSKQKTHLEKELTERQKQTYYCPHCGHSIALPKNLIDELQANNKPKLCNHCHNNFYLHEAKTVYIKVQAQWLKKQHELWLKSRGGTTNDTRGEKIKRNQT